MQREPGGSGAVLGSVLVVFSSTVQFFAVWQAVSLIRATRRHRAWSLLSAPVALLAATRLVAVAIGGSTASATTGTLVAESVILIFSVILLVGVGSIARVFRQAQEDAETVRRMSAEVRAREAQERFLVNHIPVAVAVLVGSRIAFVNRVFLDLFEVTIEQALGRPLEEFVLTGSQTALRAWLRALHSQGTGVFGRSEWQAPTVGGLRWIAMQAQRGRWDDADAVFVTGVDITEQRQAQDELRRHRENLEEVVAARTVSLRESEEAFRALAENGQDVIMRFDRECRHLYASPIVESQTGMPAREFIGKTHQELGFPEHLVAVWEPAIHKVFAAASPGRIEFQLPGGIWIDWLLIPEFDDNGEVRSVLATARDITDRKHVEEELRRHRDHLEELVAVRTAELNRANESLKREVGERQRIADALHESEERLRSLYDNVSIGLYRTTPAGRVILANPALVRMLGFASFDELAARNLEVGGFYETLTRTTFKELAERDGGVIGLESSWLRGDGTTIIVRENATAIREECGAVLYYEGTVEDITEQRRLQEQLGQARRLEALGHLAGGIAHDFNNILMAVLGSEELLRRHVEADEATVRELGIIEHAVQRGSALTHGLLAFARRQVLEPVDLDLNGAIEALLPMLRRVIPENIEIRFTPGADISPVRADRGHLDQVILNLCVNARDAMPDGGAISIRSGSVAVESAQTAPDPNLGPGCYAVLSLADTGEGIDAATLPHIFEPFFTTKAPGEGTGLGLATVYGIVQQHGGTISLASEPGQGTTFTVYLPTVTAAPVQAPRNGRQPVPGGSETILVAEDETDVRQILVEVLRGLGYRVLEATDGVEALALLQGAAGGVHLVVTDMIMPRMGGNELAAAVRTISPATAFLFSSGYMPDGVAAGLADADDVGFIAKPYSIESLARKVRALLDRHQEPAGPSRP